MVCVIIKEKGIIDRKSHCCRENKRNILLGEQTMTAQSWKVAFGSIDPPIILFLAAEESHSLAYYAIISREFSYTRKAVVKLCNNKKWNRFHIRCGSPAKSS